MSGAFRVEVLDATHDRASFCCESEPLQRYLREQADQDAKRHIAVPFVLVQGAIEIIGYYTLSSTILRAEDLPSDLLKKLKLPKYPQLPATLLGRLARHSAHRGGGIGRLLLLDALKRAYTLSKQIASLAVIVDAKDERASQFYRDYDFTPFPDSPQRLFLRMETIAQLYES